MKRQKARIGIIGFGNQGSAYVRLLKAGLVRDGVLAALFRHTTTLGVRARICRRWTLERRDEPVVLPDGSTVRCKISCGFGVRRAKYEHDDLAGLALERGVSLRELSAGLPPP